MRRNSQDIPTSLTRLPEAPPRRRRNSPACGSICCAQYGGEKCPASTARLPTCPRLLGPPSYHPYCRPLVAAPPPPPPLPSNPPACDIPCYPSSGGGECPASSVGLPEPYPADGSSLTDRWHMSVTAQKPRQHWPTSLSTSPFPRSTGHVFQTRPRATEPSNNYENKKQSSQTGKSPTAASIAGQHSPCCIHKAPPGRDWSPP